MTIKIKFKTKTKRRALSRRQISNTSVLSGIFTSACDLVKKSTKHLGLLKFIYAGLGKFFTSCDRRIFLVALPYYKFVRVYADRRVTE